MSSVYPWIFVDYRNSIWKFIQNDNKELRYNIMYGDGKWTKESLIDKNILGFAVYVEEDETIHVVYSNIKGELRYCTMKDKQWVGKMLYHMESDEFKIQNIKVEIIGEEMHIFYMLIDNYGNDHGVLMHCIWNGKETRVSTMQDVILIPDLKEHYTVHVNKKANIDLFFVTDEGDEISLNYCSFQNRKWSPVKRLYGIQGENIEFEVLRDEEEIHILNKSREDSVYFLDHVCVDTTGNIQEFRVYESINKLLEPLLFMESNKLYSCWLEQDKIFYSVFNGEKWGSADCFDRGNELTLKRYNCFICCDDENSIKARGIYGNDGLDLYLFVPSQFVVNMKDSLKYGVNEANTDTPQEKEMLQSLKLELSREKSENKSLEKKIASLNMQLQKKQRFMKEYEDRIAKISEQKRKSDENYRIFLELQQNVQKELEVTKQKFSEEEILISNLKKELKEIKKQLSEGQIITQNYQRELDHIKHQLSEEKDLIITLKKELEDKNQQLLEESKIKTSIENKLKEYEEENVIIRQQVEIINEEKKKLYEELELEKNQSIMARLLRRRSSEM